MADNLPPLQCRMLRWSGAWTCPEPPGPSRPVVGYLYFYYIKICCFHPILTNPWMYPESLLELGNIVLHWFLSCKMCAQMGRQNVSKEGGKEGQGGAWMTSKANGAMLLDFIANMARSNWAVDVCSIFLITTFLIVSVKSE